MEDVLKKIGIYDICVVWGSGGIMLTVLFILNRIYCFVDIEIIKETLKNNDGDLLVIPLLFGALILGLFFQEVSVIFSNLVFNHNHWLLHRTFYSRSPLYKNYTLNNKQLRAIMKQFQIPIAENEQLEDEKEKKGGEEKPISIDRETQLKIYHHCKYKYINQFETYRLDHDQAISGMSRSLFVFFLLIGILLAVYWGWMGYSAIKMLLGILVSFIVAALFFERYTRYAIIRYSEVIKKIVYTPESSSKSKSDAGEMIATYTVLPDKNNEQVHQGTAKRKRH